MLEIKPAISMLALIEIGREPAGRGDERGRRLDQIVGKMGGGVDLRIAVEVEPAGIMMRDHMDHQVERAQWLEPLVSERVGKCRHSALCSYIMMASRGVPAGAV